MLAALVLVLGVALLVGWLTLCLRQVVLAERVRVRDVGGWLACSSGSFVRLGPHRGRN